MNAVLLLVALSANLPGALDAGTQLTFEGSFVAEKGDPVVTQKRFTLSVLIAEADDDSVSLYWTLEEQGRGGWSWINHFGQYDARRAGTDSAPTLLYERPEGTSVIELLTPLLLRDEPLQSGIKWRQEKDSHEVVGAVKVKQHAAWQVDVRTLYGLKRQLFVDQESPLLIALKENVFIGQGEKHELNYELVARTKLDAAQLEKTITAFDGFIGLRNRLGIVPAELDVKWTDERLGVLRQHLPAVVERVTDGPLLQIAEAATRDAKDQRNRAGAVALMRERLLGTPSPQPALLELTGGAFDWSTLKGKVAVLHFWEYRDTPLEEPYGQIAYLDFLYRNRPSDDVTVIGVACHERLLDPDTHSRGVVSVKKLRSFMNLSYPIVVDHQGGVAKFGDPRVTGAKLPLFVVVGKDGKVLHHHVGTYEVNRDRGLEELDAIVKQALGTDE